MPVIRPFAAYTYSRTLGLDYSNLIAPPYDVLDEAGKAALVGRSEFNIVNVDLPFLPPKSVGPDEVYAGANERFKGWVADGILTRDSRPGFYAYEQTFTNHGRTVHRRGFYALVRLSAFGKGEVVPHEQTYAGPIEDRLKLMKATGMQLSPIFGLYNDDRNEVMTALFSHAGRPVISAEMDGVKNDLWAVHEADIEAKVIDLMKGRAIYIADGHHRYTTALQYLADRERENGGPLAPNDPANFCLFCLVSMRDPGLHILPTHRLLAGLTDFDFDRFVAAIADHYTVTPTNAEPDEKLLMHIRPGGFGVYVGGTGKVHILTPKGTDSLAGHYGQKSEAWRKLDVAILQHYLLEQVIQPLFNSGKEVKKGYSPEVSAAISHVDSENYQLAILLRPTPISALVDLGKSNEVMPQKSTYFYPKLATGLVMAALR